MDVEKMEAFRGGEVDDIYPCPYAELKDKAGLVATTTTFGLGQQGCTSSAFKDLTNALAGLGRALEVFSGLDVAGNLSTLQKWRRKMHCRQN